MSEFEMNLPFVSVIIPVFNVEPYITDCLQSVMRQTYKGEIECILVDDCSTDNSMEVAEKLIAEYDGPIEFKILHHDHNQGLSATRNTGTDVATGEYIYYLDSDDYISDDCLSILTEPLADDNYDMVIGDYETFGGGQVPSLLFVQQKEIFGNKNIFHELAEHRLPVIACNKLCKHSYLKSNGIEFLIGQLHEDDLWTYKICLCCTKISIQRKVTYYYRQRSTSIVYSDSIKQQQRFESVSKTVEYILLHKPIIVNSDYYRCSLTYIGKCLSYAINGDFAFYEGYKSMRKLIDYNPLNLYLKRQISLLELKRSIHLAMPTTMGYGYLLLRRAINKKRQ